MTNEQKNITVVITGGGTGGHIYPAIAVAQKLKNDDQIKKLYYIGCPYNMEKDIALKENIEFLPIIVRGMPRKIGFSFIGWALELFRAVKDSINHLKAIKPDVILGTGGYVSAPVLMAGALLKIPYVIHDADAHPGIVNRLMANWAKTVSISFEQSKKYIHTPNVVVNGNPVRSNFNKITKEKALNVLCLNPDKKTILVMGGSQGAQRINDALMGAVSKLILDHDFQVIHQTGKKNFEEYIQKIAVLWPEFSNCSGYIVKPYIDDMAVPLAASDLVVSRAGSLSISELNLSNLPSILVPYPYAAADHQRFNARAMEKAGASLYLEDFECNADTLINLIIEVLSSPDRLFDMQEANMRLAKPQATKNIIKNIKNAAGLSF